MNLFPTLFDAPHRVVVRSAHGVAFRYPRDTYDQALTDAHAESEAFFALRVRELFVIEVRECSSDAIVVELAPFIGAAS